MKITITREIAEEVDIPTPFVMKDGDTLYYAVKDDLIYRITPEGGIYTFRYSNPIDGDCIPATIEEWQAALEQLKKKIDAMPNSIPDGINV